MYTMLHYPLVNPPRSTIFEAILYWDQLASVVPMRRDANYPDVLDLAVLRNDLRLLQQEGLYTPLWAENVIDNGDSLFYDLDFEIESALATFGAELPPPDPELSVYSRLWYGKVPYNVEAHLVARGALVPSEKEAGAWQVNRIVLQALMAVLARHIAARTEWSQPGTRYVPCTSSDFAHLCATAPVVPPRRVPAWRSPDPSRHEVEHSWLLDVSNVLPVPDTDTPIEDVVEFAREFSEERNVCVRGVRELQARLSSTTSNATELVLESEREIRSAVSELKRAGKARFGRLALRSVLITVATGGSYVGAEALDLPAILASAGAVASGYAINIASAPTRPRSDELSYLYQLERRFPSAAL